MHSDFHNNNHYVKSIIDLLGIRLTGPVPFQ